MPHKKRSSHWSRFPITSSLHRNLSWSACRFIRKRLCRREDRRIGRRRKRSKRWENWEKIIRNCTLSSLRKSSNCYHKRRRNMRGWRPKCRIERVYGIEWWTVEVYGVVYSVIQLLLLRLLFMWRKLSVKILSRCLVACLVSLRKWCLQSSWIFGMLVFCHREWSLQMLLERGERL